MNTRLIFVQNLRTN